MKILAQIIYIPVLLLCGLLSHAQDAATIDSTYINGHYTQRLDFFRKMPNLKKEIVFLGNSITEGGKWQELFRHKNIVNRGISGDVTYGVIARLDEVLAAQPKKIFLLIGVNDMKRGIPNAVIVANYKRIIQMVKAQSPKTKLILQSLLPVNEKMLPAIYVNVNNEKINQLNQQLQELCKLNELTYVNLHPALADAQGNLRKELSIDGLHLRQESYVLWADYLKKLKLM